MKTNDQSEKNKQLNTMLSDIGGILNNVKKGLFSAEAVIEKQRALYSNLEELEGMRIQFGTHDPQIDKVEAFVNKAIETLNQHEALNI